MRHVSVISEYPISTGFHGLMGCQRDPRDKGVIDMKLVYTTKGEKFPLESRC